MKRIIIACTAALLFPTLCGCGQRVMRCTADEVKNASWECRNENSSFALLVFDGDYAVMTLESGDEKTVIEGLCVADDNTLIILDDINKYSFEYVVAGKTLTLKTNDKEAVFERVSE